MRGRAVLVAYLAAAIGAALVAVPVARLVLPGPAGAAPPAPTTPSAPVFTPNLQVAGQPSPPPATVHAPADPAAIKAPGYVTFFGWSLLDRHSGAATGSANRENVTNTAESMIKVWIVADYLRHHGPAAASAIPELTKVIVNSDDDLAYKFYEQDGGDGAIRELVSVCGLHSTRPPYLADRWSYTTISPADAMRLGQCVASGTAAGPNWTNWLLDTMRKVNGGVADQQRSSGGGHWGIIDALPPAMVAQTSIKNGWTPQTYDHDWHVNCLAIHPDWVLAIELRYPWTSLDGNWEHANNLQQGADACASVTRQLLTPPDI